VEKDIIHHNIVIYTIYTIHPLYVPDFSCPFLKVFLSSLKSLHVDRIGYMFMTVENWAGLRMSLVHCSFKEKKISSAMVLNDEFAHGLS